MNQTYEKVCLTWDAPLLGLVLFYIIGCQLSHLFKRCASRALERLATFLIDWSRISAGRGEAWLTLSLLAGVIGGMLLYPEFFGATKWDLVQLPDTAKLNQLLTLAGENVTLFPCTVKSAFQVYVGFADSCPQLQDCFQPEFFSHNRSRLAHESVLFTVLMMLASMVFFGSGTFLAIGVLYGVCIDWPRRMIAAPVKKLE